MEGKNHRALEREWHAETVHPPQISRTGVEQQMYVQGETEQTDTAAAVKLEMIKKRGKNPPDTLSLLLCFQYTGL